MPAFDYTSRDYLSIRQDLINRAASLIPEWDSKDASEFGNVFIDLWAYMGDILHFYVDRAAQETFLETATQRDSVMAIANLLDYIPASPRSSRGSVVFQLSGFPETSVKSIVISSATTNTTTIDFTTQVPHGLTAGQKVTISGMSPTTFNISNVIISAIVSPTVFSIAKSSYTSVPSGSSTSGTTGLLNYNIAYVVPQYTTLTGYDSNGVAHDFYTEVDSLPLVDLTSQVSCRIAQGTITTNENIGTSAGTSNQLFTLMKKNVDVDSITIQVQEGPISGGVPGLVTYQYVNNLSSANYLDKVFTARVKSDGYTQILFGNGFNGVIPTTNANIFASYRTTDGSVGNLVANSIKFINGFSSSYVNIVSSSATSGGSDMESINSIKNNVSRLYRTQDRAVSLQDYKDLCLQIPGVSKATAVYNSSTKSVTLYPVPHQTDYPPLPVLVAGSGKVVVEIPTTMVESVEAYFKTRSMIGVSAQVVDPVDIGSIQNYIECTPIYVGMKVYVRDNYVQSWVKKDVDSAIRELLQFSNVFFGQKITAGEVYRAALTVNGVDYVELTTLSTTYDNDPTTIGTVGDITVDSTKLPCFTNFISGAPLAVSLAMYGGITGSN